MSDTHLKVLENAIAQSPIYVFEYSRDMVCIAVFHPPPGFLASDFVGKQFKDFAGPPEQVETLVAFKKEVMLTGRPVEVRGKKRLKVNGILREAVYDEFICPLWDATRSIVGCSCTSIDVTVRHELEVKLVHNLGAATESSKAKSEFLAMMSHQIRTPLTAALGALGLLRDDPESSSRVDLLSTAMKGCELLLGIVNDILDYTKIETGRMTMCYEPIDVKQVLQDAIQLESFKATENDNQVIVTIDQEIPPVMLADPGRLTQLVLNMLSNAVKFTSGGKITVTAKTTQPFDPTNPSTCFPANPGPIRIQKCEGVSSLVEHDEPADQGSFAYLSDGFAALVFMPQGQHQVALPEDDQRRMLEAPREKSEQKSEPKIPPTPPNPNVKHLQITIKDTGIGMPADVLPRLFRRFTQSEAGIWRKYGGSGLGLAIVRRLTYLMHGCLGVITKPQGGSTFWVSLPLVVPDLCTNKPDESKVIHDAHTIEMKKKTTRVLLAEDNKPSQKVVSGLLTRLGWQVVTTNDGEEAFKIITAEGGENIKVVLMDCQMPNWDGVRATKELRVWEARASSPRDRLFIVALTADVVGAAREKYIGEGMDAYCPKPVSLQALRELMDAWACGSTLPTFIYNPSERVSGKLSVEDQLA